jgi:integrase
MARLSRDDEAVRDLPPPSKHKRIVPDAVLPRLLLVVHPGGGKTWALRTYPRPGVPSTRRIGTWPDMPVQEARIKASLLDPAKAAKGDNRTFTEAAADAVASDTVAAVAKAFVAGYVEPRKLRSQGEIERALAKYVLPIWGDMPLPSIKRADVRKLLTHIGAAHGAVMADRVLSYIRKLMSWYAGGSDDYISPITKDLWPSKSLARSRTLNDDELRVLWRLSDAMGPFGVFIKILVLTGQRRRKVEELEWRDLNLANGVWTIRRSDGEKGTPARLVLPPLARGLLEGLHPVAGDPRVFATVGWVIHGKQVLAKRMEAELGEVPHWNLHDLRRTARTLMPRAGVPPYVAERVLGHAIRGVQGVYDRYDYVTEMQQALAKLADLIAGIVREAPGKAAHASGRRRAAG